MKTSKTLILVLAGCSLLAASLSAQVATTNVNPRGVTATPARPVPVNPVDRRDHGNDRIEAARIKAARLKAARIQNAREDAANNDTRRDLARRARPAGR